MPQRHDNRPRQGRQIHHELGLEPVLAVPNCVGQNETPFRIGVDDLDRLARHRRHHVVRALSIAVGHILNHTQDAHGIHLGLASRQHVHQSGDSRRPAHVCLHALHTHCRFQAIAAGIEANPLTDKGDRLGRRVAGPVPLDDDQLALTNAALSDTQQGSHAQLGHLRLAKNFDF